MRQVETIRIGTAGWAIPRASACRFDADGTHLQRYARRFSCVEINSCFYRAHRHQTYVRWRESTPAEFQFSVKLPRAITHERRLQDPRAAIVEFLQQTDGLAEKRGPILVQLPPSLAYERPVASAFFKTMRSHYAGPIVFEPRHPTWFTADVESLLLDQRVARVAADPPPVGAASAPAGWPELVYFRLHGSPRTYWSRYEGDDIATLGQTLRYYATRARVWCVFDNTALGAAVENAWELEQRLNTAPAN
jgi:uncharacterized protein YecE (DUF72 family)